MKTRSDLHLTYMGNLQQAWYAGEVADTRDIDQLLSQFQRFNSVIHHSFPMFFVIDYIAQQYLVMTNEVRAISGYHPSEFLESRMEKLLDIFHKDDFRLFNQEIFTRNAQLLQETPQAAHHELVFSYNFRFIRQDKKLAQVLQRSSYITSPKTGLPLYSLGMIIDISDVKTDSVMVHTVEHCTGTVKEKLFTHYYYPDLEDAVLTKRELMVLQYLSEGYSSKQVADRMYVSEHTITNHKQNMMRKTNTKNVTELVVFAVRNRLI